MKHFAKVTVIFLLIMCCCFMCSCNWRKGSISFSNRTFVLDKSIYLVDDAEYSCLLHHTTDREYIIETFSITFKKISQKEFKRRDGKNVLKNNCDGETYEITVYIKFEGERDEKQYDCYFVDVMYNMYTVEVVFNNEQIGLDIKEECTIVIFDEYTHTGDVELDVCFKNGATFFAI